MNSNLHETERVIDFIEAHLLEEKLDLDTISKEIGYSKYHLHRMFTSVVGFTIHNYILRRRLTEAARQLVHTDRPVLDIALASGYESQRSFSRSFKAMFRHSPDSFRKRGSFLPIQLKYDVNSRERLRGDRILDIMTVEEGPIYLTGYSRSTRRGFSVIGKCWREMHRNKEKIRNRADKRFLIGVNDYSGYEAQEFNPAFTYIAAAQVTSPLPELIPGGMRAFVLPRSSYAVFTFRGRNEDSLQPVVDYIYREWFPNSTCRFNENNLYDFVKYGEEADETGQSEIQFWVPLI